MREPSFDLQADFFGDLPAPADMPVLAPSVEVPQVPTESVQIVDKAGDCPSVGDPVDNLLTLAEKPENNPVTLFATEPEQTDSTTPAPALAENTEKSAVTLFEIEPKETYKTDITYQTIAAPTSNRDVLRAVFAGLEEPTRPMVLGFAGKPKAQKSWGGYAWHPDSQVMTDKAGLNWYLTLAAYHPGDKYRKTEKQCAAIWGVMLDDLGTKAAPLERLAACPPCSVPAIYGDRNQPR